VLALISALGSLISYVREDEQLQLSVTVFSEDLSAAHIGVAASAGMSRAEALLIQGRFLYKTLKCAPAHSMPSKPLTRVSV
jgi:hypothetical protein